MREHHYIARVLAEYLRLPHTPDRPRAADRAVAAQLHRRGIPLATVRAALLLATARRLQRPADAVPLAPVRSLAYFLPVVEEVDREGIGEGYVGYLEGLLDRRCKTPQEPR